jgi:hypothetical protein
MANVGPAMRDTNKLIVEILLTEASCRVIEPVLDVANTREANCIVKKTLPPGGVTKKYSWPALLNLCLASPPAGEVKAADATSLRVQLSLE